MQSAVRDRDVERVHDERRARELVAEWKASGMSVAAFCRVRRIASWSFYPWCRERPAMVPALIEVKVATLEPQRQASNATYELELANGRTLRIGDDFRDETLVRLVGVLERAC